MNAALREILDGAKEDLVAALGRARYSLWFRDAAVQGVAGRTVTLAVPTDVHRTWLQVNYQAALEQAFSRVLGEGTSVAIEVNERLASKREIRDRMPQGERQWQALLSERRAKPTLVGFVADGGGNAFAARLLAQVVHGSAGEPSGPILLYGPSGSGKTHLLRATHEAIDAKAPGSSAFFSARGWTNRFVSAVRSGESRAVRAFEAGIEARRVVCLDGLEVLTGRDATQAELSGLLDRAASTRFVVASRVHPRDVPGLSERLASRLLSGVVVSLSAPDAAAIAKILAARAASYGLPLPADVRDAVLSRAPSPHAAAEWLDRWAVVSSAQGRPLDLAWLEEALPPVAPETVREGIVERAKEVVARHYGVPRSALDGPQKRPNAVMPRRIAMYLVHRAAAMSLEEVAKAFGLRSHSAASRAVAEVRARRDADPSVEVEVEALLKRL